MRWGVRQLRGVDHLHLGRVGEFKGGRAGVKDYDTRIAVALERGALGQAERVTIKRQSGLEILGFDDEAKLLHAAIGARVVWMICHVDYGRT